MIKLTTAAEKLLDLKERIKVVQGGTSASKTFSILMILIDRAQTNKNLTIHVISESYPHLRDGAIKDFKTILLGRNYWEDDRWNKTEKEYSFETGTTIKFLSIDKLGKAHGPRRDILFLNEANNVEWQIVDQLMARTRGDIWIDYNPSSEFWFHEHIKDSLPHDFIILNYKDNEALDQTVVEYIESKREDKNWWTVYGLGHLGEIEGRVYTGWKTIQEVPEEARLVRYGLDFGYSNDPTAIVEIYKYNDGFILNEIRYMKGLQNSEIADFMKNREKALIIADSAEPKSIDELKLHGLDIIGAEKGPGSINRGIDFVKDQRIQVTISSYYLLKEYNAYLWKTDTKTGKHINEVIGGNDHLLDAIRYGLSSLKVNEETPKQLQERMMRRQRLIANRNNGGSNSTE